MYVGCLENAGIALHLEKKVEKFTYSKLNMMTLGLQQKCLNTLQKIYFIVL